MQEEEEETSCRCITSAELEDSSLSLETCSRAAISSHKARAEKCLQMSQPQRRVRGVMAWVKVWGVMVWVRIEGMVCASVAVKVDQGVRVVWE